MENEQKTKEQLIEELEQYRSLFKTAFLAYQFLDESGIIIDANDAWCKLFDYSKDETIGKSFREFLSPAFYSHFDENFPLKKGVGQNPTFELEMIKKGGGKTQYLH
jgi:PAS domain S-box-containing protein